MWEMCRALGVGGTQAAALVAALTRLPTRFPWVPLHTQHGPKYSVCVPSTQHPP